MKMPSIVIILLLAAGATACTTQTTRDLRLGPTFTDAQKELMADDEKLAIYNAQVRDEDKLECEMRVVAGSRRPQEVCETKKERDWSRTSSQQALRKSRHFQSCLATERGCSGATGAP